MKGGSKIHKSLKDRTGEMRFNNKGTLMKIVKYDTYNHVDIEFQDAHRYVVINSTYSNFKKGQVKNPYDKTICNIGYLGVGRFKAGSKLCTEYNIWKSMLARCYANNGNYTGYYGVCTVCEEWHNYQNFAEWYHANYYNVDERLHLGKDILVPGNKEYSPSKCILIPQRINMLVLNRPNKRGLPNGVVKVKSGYLAKYNNKELGIFKTIDEARAVQLSEKKFEMINILKQYQNIIPRKTYIALINYDINRTPDKNYKVS